VHSGGRDPLNTLSIHDYASVIATGSQKQFVKVLNTNGKSLNTIRYHDGFLGQRIGPVNSLAFHPHQLLLASGCRDRYISIFKLSA
jgi:regulatory associated protein of mTOR